MKRSSKYLVIPIQIADHGDLTVIEKWVLANLDSVCTEEQGVAIGAQAIASLCGISLKESKETLSSLHVKGALVVNLDENGTKLIKPLLYKERYISSNEPILGDSPKDATPIDFNFIQEQWNEICHMLPKVTLFTPRRKAKTRTSMKGAGIEVVDLIKVFRLVSTSEFLTGARGDWQCTFDWVVKSADNIQKILDGNYHKSYPEKLSFEYIMAGNEIPQAKNCDDEYR